MRAPKGEILVLYGVVAADRAAAVHLAATKCLPAGKESREWSWADENFAFRMYRRAVAYDSDIPVFLEDGRGALAVYGSVVGQGTVGSERSTADGGAPASVVGTPAEILGGRGTSGTTRLLRQLEGSFVFVLWDKKQRKLQLARDRIGGPPLYYGWINGVFVFSTRLDLFRNHLGFFPSINRNALALLLRYSYVPSPHTIYHEVYKLVPGALLTVDVDGDAIKSHLATYWTMREVLEARPSQRSDVDIGSVVSHTEALILRSIRRRAPERQVGVFLSGGIDSTVVAALAQSVSTRPIKTFTIGVRNETLDEAVYAKEIAKYLGTEHCELYVTVRDAMDVIPRLPHVYDEPFADPSQIPTLLVSQLASRSADIVLSGDGGDEVFCGYNRYVWGQRIWGTLGQLPLRLRRVAARLALSLPTSRWERLFRPITRLLPSRYRISDVGTQMHKLGAILDVTSPEEMYVRLTSHWREPTSVVIGAVEPEAILSDDGEWANREDFVSRMMYLDMTSFLPDGVLVKVWKAAAASGIDVRSPLLDIDLIRYAWSLPLCTHLHEGEGKRVLKQVLHRHIPRRLVDRPKTGFGIPLADWLRGPLRDWAESLLDEHRLHHQGFFRPEPIRRCWEEHLSGRRDWQDHLWAVLMFQAWLDAHHG